MVYDKSLSLKIDKHFFKYYASAEGNNTGLHYVLRNGNRKKYYTRNEAEMYLKKVSARQPAKARQGNQGDYQPSGKVISVIRSKRKLY